MTYQIYTDEQLVSAIEQARGNLTKAAEIAGCAVTTIKKRIETSEKVRDAFDIQRERLVSKAIDNVYSFLDDPDENMRWKATNLVVNGILAKHWGISPKDTEKAREALEIQLSWNLDQKAPVIGEVKALPEDDR